MGLRLQAVWLMPWRRRPRRTLVPGFGANKTAPVLERTTRVARQHTNATKKARLAGEKYWLHHTAPTYSLGRGDTEGVSGVLGLGRSETLADTVTWGFGIAEE